MKFDIYHKEDGYIGTANIENVDTDFMLGDRVIIFGDIAVNIDSFDYALPVKEEVVE